MKQRMPAGPKGRSTNPPATTGGGGAPRVGNGRSNDKVVNVTHSPRDAARGNHVNGDHSNKK